MFGSEQSGLRQKLLDAFRDFGTELSPCARREQRQGAHILAARAKCELARCSARVPVRVRKSCRPIEVKREWTRRTARAVVIRWVSERANGFRQWRQPRLRPSSSRYLNQYAALNIGAPTVCGRREVR